MSRESRKEIELFRETDEVFRENWEAAEHQHKTGKISKQLMFSVHLHHLRNARSRSAKLKQSIHKKSELKNTVL